MLWDIVIINPEWDICQHLIAKEDNLKSFKKIKKETAFRYNTINQMGGNE